MAVCPPTPRLAPGQDPFQDLEPLELPPLDDDEAPAKICSVAPKAPRLSPAAVPFENCTIPELWLPEAESTDDECNDYEVAASITGLELGPAGICRRFRPVDTEASASQFSSQVRCVPRAVRPRVVYPVRIRHGQPTLTILENPCLWRLSSWYLEALELQRVSFGRTFGHQV
mmetsp:Transcript_72882/g.115829  ORF Transcript_72882/g.115829 Transcript_72882/m.115829 type:complete len:172 (+) Transcript_72882:84-599(+)